MKAFATQVLSGKQPEQEPENFTQHIQKAVQKKADEHPAIEEIRTFWNNLQELRDWWPLLLPVFAWIGWHTYRTERRKVRKQAIRKL
jgi:hypothetical protein